jgi:type IV pilus assembly protein PilB
MTGHARDCQVELLDGKVLDAQLLIFRPGGLAAVDVELSGGRGRERIAFEHLRTIRLSVPLLLGDDNAPVADVASENSFSIRFSDGKTFAGITRGFVRENAGLFLYLPVANHRELVRCFIPAQHLDRVEFAQIPTSSAASNRQIDAHEPGRVGGTQIKSLPQKNGSVISKAAAAEPAQQHAQTRQEARQRMTLGELLLSAHVVSPTQLDAALRLQAANHERRLGEILLELGSVTATQLQTATLQQAKMLGLKLLSDEELRWEQAALDQIPAELARDIHVLPLRVVDGRLHVAIADPTDPQALSALSFLCKQSPVLEVASPAAIERALEKAYMTLKDDQAVLEEMSPEVEDAVDSARELESSVREAPIVKLVDNMLVEALRKHASDIHLRPAEHVVEQIFRIDGDMTLIRRFNKRLLPGVVGRIKVMGRMDITQRRIPQDGQARIRSEGTWVDLRISVIPTIEGESVVIRVLKPVLDIKDVNHIGLTEGDSKRVGDLLQRSTGMILVTGPTGSGKSSTLYAALKTVISSNVNIITVENPVEYRIQGIEQVPVLVEQGMTFAKALRNILRHDPDVIMIGEIRDAETARIAVESGLTGHLVLSTLHTNSAAGTMSRLLEMGVEDYLLRATLLAIIAQRLVRKICPACKVRDEAGGELRAIFGAAPDEPFYHGAGCAECQQRGYRGRRMTYELMVVTPELRKLIRHEIDAELIQRQAIADEMLPLTQHALALAQAGEISLEEVLATRIQ